MHREGTGIAVLQSGRLGLSQDSYRVTGVECTPNGETGLVSACKKRVFLCGHLATSPCVFRILQAGQ